MAFLSMLTGVSRIAESLPIILVGSRSMCPSDAIACEPSTKSQEASLLFCCKATKNSRRLCDFVVVPTGIEPVTLGL